MEDSDWIDVRKRMPEAQDADATGRVLAWHALNGAMMIGWNRVPENRFITHWQRTPEGPEGFRDLAKSALYGTEERFR